MSMNQTHPIDHMLAPNTPRPLYVLGTSAPEGTLLHSDQRDPLSTLLALYRGQVRHIDPEGFDAYAAMPLPLEDLVSQMEDLGNYAFDDHVDSDHVTVYGPTPNPVTEVWATCLSLIHI